MYLLSLSYETDFFFPLHMMYITRLSLSHSLNLVRPVLCSHSYHSLYMPQLIQNGSKKYQKQTKRYINDSIFANVYTALSLTFYASKSKNCCLLFTPGVTFFLVGN